MLRRMNDMPVRAVGFEAFIKAGTGFRARHANDPATKTWPVERVETRS